MSEDIGDSLQGLVWRLTQCEELLGATAATTRRLVTTSLNSLEARLQNLDGQIQNLKAIITALERRCDEISKVFNWENAILNGVNT